MPSDARFVTYAVEVDVAGFGAAHSPQRILLDSEAVDDAYQAVFLRDGGLVEGGRGGGGAVGGKMFFVCPEGCERATTGDAFDETMTDILGEHGLAVHGCVNVVFANKAVGAAGEKRLAVEGECHGVNLTG